MGKILRLWILGQFRKPRCPLKKPSFLKFCSLVLKETNRTLDEQRKLSWPFKCLPWRVKPIFFLFPLSAHSFTHSCLSWSKQLQVYSPNFTSPCPLPSKAHILGYGNQMTRTDMFWRGDTGQFVTLEI